MFIKREKSIINKITLYTLFQSQINIVNKNYHDNEEAFSDSDSSATSTLLGSPFSEQVDDRNIDAIDLIEIEELISLLDNNEQKLIISLIH